MATQHYRFDFECPDCGEQGHAHGTDNDNGPNFRITDHTLGFKPGSTPNPFNQRFVHRCGRVVESAIEEL